MVDGFHLTIRSRPVEYAAEYFTWADSLFDTGSSLLMFYGDIIPFSGGVLGNSFNRLVNEGF